MSATKKAIKENEALQSQIDELQEKLKGTSGMPEQDDLESQVKSLQDELTSLQEGRKKEAVDYEVKLALSNADCIDVVGAMAHLDRNKLELKNGELTGLDVKKLKKDLPHLFKTPNIQNSAVLNQGELRASENKLLPK